MYAIDFEATIENGMIPITQQNLAQLQPQMKVVAIKIRGETRGSQAKG